ncbi:histidine phosphatase family protein [Nanoarchaeota archaeon]
MRPNILQFDDYQQAQEALQSILESNQRSTIRTKEKMPGAKHIAMIIDIDVDQGQYGFCASTTDFNEPEFESADYRSTTQLAVAISQHVQLTDEEDIHPYVISVNEAIGDPEHNVTPLSPLEKELIEIELRRVSIDGKIDLYLINQAQSEMQSQPNIICGQSIQTPLSVIGVQQSEYLGRRLRYERAAFHEVYSSTSVGAGVTSRIMSQEMRIPISNPRTYQELLELSLGDWEGKAKDTTFTPEIIEDILDDPIDFAPPNGESMRDGADRMYTWIARNILNREEPDLSICIVGHSMIFKAFLQRVLGFDPHLIYTSDLENTGITQLRYDPDGWQLVRYNDSAHLTYNP